MSKPLVYLSGPMSGLPDHNFPAFFAAQRRIDLLRSYVTINPAETASLDKEERSWGYHMRRDIRHLLTCDMIAMLPGWENSRGATLERRIALELGMPAFYLDGHSWELCQRVGE